MAKGKRSELAAGVFVLLALAAGVGVLIWLGAADVLTQRGQKVVFFVQQGRGTLGLAIGSAVKVNDAAIGKIKAIRFDPASKRTFYETRLERKDVQVGCDARAVAVVEFIGGASVVLENFGSGNAPLAGDSNPIPLNEGPSSLFRQAQDVLGYGDKQREQFQQALSSVATAADNVKGVTDTLVREFDLDNSAALLVEVKDTVASLKATSANLLVMAEKLKLEMDKNQAQALLSKVHVVADHVTKLAENASGMMVKVRPDVEATVGKIRQYVDKDLAVLLAGLRTSNNTLLEIIGDIKTLTGNAKDVIVLNRENIDEIVLNMKSMSLNLSAAAKEIRRNPWRLVQRPKPGEVDSQNIYDAARAFAEGAEQLDDALTRLDALRKARPAGVTAGDPELAKILAHLQGSFEKFRTVEDALWKELSK